MGVAPTNAAGSYNADGRQFAEGRQSAGGTAADALTSQCDPTESLLVCALRVAAQEAAKNQVGGCAATVALA
eukprot:2535945-Prymnesium_polylepis.1